MMTLPLLLEYQTDALETKGNFETEGCGETRLRAAA